MTTLSNNNNTITPRKFYSAAYLAYHPELAAAPISLPQSNVEAFTRLPTIVSSANLTLSVPAEPTTATTDNAYEPSKQEAQAPMADAVAVEESEASSVEREEEKPVKMIRYPIVCSLLENTNYDGTIISWADEPWDAYEFLDLFHGVALPHIPRGHYITNIEHNAAMPAKR